MGCFNSSSVSCSQKKIRLHSDLYTKIMQYSVSGNLPSLKKTVNLHTYGSFGSEACSRLDFSLIQGYQKIVKFDDLLFSTVNWGPLLLSIDANQFAVAEYYIDTLQLNPSLYLVKPKTHEENQVNLKLKAVKDAQDRRDYS